MRDIRKRGSRGDRGRRDGRDRDLGKSVGNALGRAFRRLNRTVSAALRPQGLSAVQGNLLLALWAQGPTPMGALQRGLGLSSSAFTGAIDRMERAGHVRRVPAPNDRRSFLLEPAPWPRARRAELIEALLAAEDEFLAPLAARERAELLRLLAKLADAGELAAAEAGRPPRRRSAGAAA